MSSIASLQLTTPIAGQTNHVSPITDLLRYNSLAYSAFYSHASLAICNLKLYFSTDNLTFTLYKEITLNNTITSTGNELIPSRYFKFEIENPDINAMSLINILFTAHKTATSNIDVNIGSDDIVISGVATEATQLLVKTAVENVDDTLISGSSKNLSSAPQFLCYGRTNDNVLTALKTGSDSRLEVNTEINISPVNKSLTDVEDLPQIAIAGYIEDVTGTYFRNLRLTTGNVLMVSDVGLNKNRVNVDDLYTNANLAVGNVSSTISMGNGENRFSQIQIVGDSVVNGGGANSFDFILQYSTDNIKWYSDGVTNSVYTVGTRNQFAVSRINISVPYVRVFITTANTDVNMSYSLTT